MCSTGVFYIAVRGFDPSQRGGYSLTLASGTGPGGPGGACSPPGATLSNGHGSISFSADQYTNNARCDWHITCSAPGTRATATFRRLDTEQNFDNVNLYLIIHSKILASANQICIGFLCHLQC